MERRKFIKQSLIVGGMAAIGTNSIFASIAPTWNVADEFTLPKLPYAFDALEPIIDKMTMEIHHGKHHQAYINNLNKALMGKEKTWKNIEDICKDRKMMKTDLLRNNAGGHYNHSLFWELMKPAPITTPSGKLAEDRKSVV